MSKEEAVDADPEEKTNASDHGLRANGIGEKKVICCVLRFSPIRGVPWDARHLLRILLLCVASAVERATPAFIHQGNLRQARLGLGFRT